MVYRNLLLLLPLLAGAVPAPVVTTGNSGELQQEEFSV